MRKLLTIAGLLFCTIGELLAQNLDLHFNLGYFTIGDQRAIELPSVGINANLGFFYQLNNQWSMGVSLNRSWNNYYRELWRTLGSRIRACYAERGSLPPPPLSTDVQ